MTSVYRYMFYVFPTFSAGNTSKTREWRQKILEMHSGKLSDIIERQGNKRYKSALQVLFVL